MPVFNKLVGFSCNNGNNGATNNSEISKTGMGSSASLTTSFITSLLGYFGALGDGGTTTAENLRPKTPVAKSLTNRNLGVIHNLTQIAHSLSQGKIGSGFDVSSAVYGSHIYTRFNEEIITNFINGGKNGEELVRLVDEDENSNNTNPGAIWDNTKQRFTLPKGFYVIMADIKGGSDTPSMSRNVMKYLQDNKGCGTSIWEDLRLANVAVLKAFQEIESLVVEDEEVYDIVLDYISDVHSSDWTNSIDKISTNKTNKPQASKVLNSIINLKSAFKTMRTNLKHLGVASSVPIEPNQQTKLASSTESHVPGVLSCFVPGAGGYDAICCLSICESKTKHKIIDYWEGYDEVGDEGGRTTVCPLLAEYDDGLGVELIVEN